jgi:hypothetical protein
MEEGFDPVIMDDTSVFGGGFNVEQLVGQVRRGMNTFSQAARGESIWKPAVRSKGWYSYREDEDEDEVAPLHVIKLDLDQVPEKHAAKVTLLMEKYLVRSFSQTYSKNQIEALGFQKSMDALLLENELETFTRE